jgi:hypothetical protein
MNDLYVGELGGTIYMDTLKTISFSVGGNSLAITNAKANGSIDNYIAGSSACNWTQLNGVSTILATLDSATGFTQKQGNIQLTGGTQQIKIPKDTATDYDANDSITVNKQWSIVTSKSLTTAAGLTYTLTVRNSLIVTTSGVLAEVQGGSNSAGRPIKTKSVPGNGEVLITFENYHASDALNGTLIISILINN